MCITRDLLLDKGIKRVYLNDIPTSFGRACHCHSSRSTTSYTPVDISVRNSAISRTVCLKGGLADRQEHPATPIVAILPACANEGARMASTNVAVSAPAEGQQGISKIIFSSAAGTMISGTISTSLAASPQPSPASSIRPAPALAISSPGWPPSLSALLYARLARSSSVAWVTELAARTPSSSR